MKNTTEYLFEPFLTQYFLLDSIFGGFLADEAREKTWSQLANIFCLPKGSELDEYYAEANSPHYREVTDLASYERLCRMIEYAEKTGQEIGVTDLDRIILSEKRAAMQMRAEIFKNGKNLTVDAINTTLLNMAMDGNIDAMTTLAYMEYHGICRCRDERNAIKRIRYTAKWNNIFGNLMGIAYDTERRSEYYNNLYTILRNATDKRLFTHICELTGYTGVPVKNPVARITDKAFGLNIIQRNRYDQVFARVAFSELISVEDKEKLLLNKQKEAIVSLSDLPFDVEDDGSLAFDEECVEELALKRDGEVRRILKNIAVALKCSREVYTPLLIVSKDRFVSDMYGKMIKSGFGNSAVVEIDAGTLTSVDFSGGRENVFLRGLSETKSARTVFIIRDCEELDERQLIELEKVLDHDYRKKYKLFSPPVSVDISGILIVMLANTNDATVMRLAKRCDTVIAEPVSVAEKTESVDALFAERLHCFGLDGVELDAKCREYLASYDMTQIRQIIDGALKSAVYDDTECITLECLKQVCADQNITTATGGFGYTGGEYNA